MEEIPLFRLEVFVMAPLLILPWPAMLLKVEVEQVNLPAIYLDLVQIPPIMFVPLLQNSAGTAYGNQIDFATSGMATVNTTSVSSITVDSATIEGDVTSDGGTYVDERGFVFSTTTNPTTSDNKLATGSGTGNFSGTITGLTIDTQYFVRSYATNSAGTAYGNEVNFTTLGLASVSTSPFSIALVQGAFVGNGGGEVISNGGTAVTARGVCYGTQINPTTSNSTVSAGSGVGAFTTDISGLTAETKIYIRAYATNSVGTSYGENIEVFTIAVGYYYLGGLIAHIDASGEHGLIISTNDLSTFEQWRDPAWSPPVYTYATGTAIGEGFPNTILIMGTQGNSGVFCCEIM